MKNSILPIGSIVRANNQDLMICSYLKKDALVQGKHYDYVCCLYPNGVQEESVLIQKEQIQKIIFIGFQDARFEMMKKIMESQNA